MGPELQILKSVLKPPIPGLINGAAVALVVIATEVAVRALRPSVSAVELLLSQIAVAGITYVGLIVFSPFSRVRDVVQETLYDFAPAVARRIYAESSPPIVTKT